MCITGRKWQIGVIVCLISQSVLTAGCGSPLPDGQPALSDPFLLQMTGGDGLRAQLAGFARGYQPGQTAELKLRFENGGATNWQSRYCLALMDPGGGVHMLAQGSLDLPPGHAEEQTLRVHLPEHLELRPYGLALVAPDRFANVVTVRLGDSLEAFVGSWATPSCPE